MARPWIAACLVAVLAAPAVAEPPDPLELAHGLRDHGFPDLALEYLDDLAKTNPSASLTAVLPLERARARLETARDEPDESRRDAQIAKARDELGRFLRDAGAHPRRAEAAVTLARLLSVEGQGMLARAAKIDDDKARKAAQAKARPVFDEAAKRFGQAAAELAKKLDNPNLTPSDRRDLTRDVLQAEFDRALNQFELARTYEPPEGAKEVEARGKALDEAKKLFNDLAVKDITQPICWVARAWAGECDREKDSPIEARKVFEEVKTAALRNPAAVAGARQVRFFEARAEFLSANSPADLRKAQAALEQWLNDPAIRSARPTTEVFAARWYLAYTRDLLGRGLLKKDPKTGQVAVPAEARALLRQAEMDYARVLDPENEYSARAAEKRTEVVRLLVGDKVPDPATLTTFDDAAMAAQVQLYRAVREAKTAEERTSLMRQAVTLYERADELPAPADADRDVLDAKVNLAFAYLMSDRPHRAAVLGEHLARTTRSAAVAAKAGLYAVQAYLNAATQVDPADAESRRADQARAVAVAGHLDQAFPTDPSTDAARLLIGQLHLRDGKYREAFELLSHVPAASPQAAKARQLQGLAAYELLRPSPTGEADDPTRKLTPAQRAAIYRRAVADLKALPAPPPSAAAEDAQLAVQLALLLAELHLTQKPNGYADAEKAAKDAAARLASYTAFPDDDRQEAAYRIENARLRAVWAQAVPLFQAGKYAEVMKKIDPELSAIAKAGPAVKKDQAPEVAAAAKALDEFRREGLLVLALQTRIREGAVDKAAGLFDLLKRLGGTLDASVDALANLIATVRPQIDALRKEGKTDEADKLVQGMAKVLDKVAAEPGVTPKVQLFLGVGLKEVGNYEKAEEVLKKVPAPPADQLGKRASDLDDKARAAVAQYRKAQQELAATYRLAGRFDDAEKVLTEALGTKEKPGWAAGSHDFRREAAYLLEARAAAEPDPTAARKLWGEALQKWNEMAAEQLSPLRKLGAGKKDGKAAFLALLELKALPPSQDLPTKDGAPDEQAIRKGLREAKPPQWVTKLLDTTETGEDGTERPSAYVQTLQATVTRLEAQVKPTYHDLFFESTRCITRANAHMLKDRPAELKTKYEAIAKQIRDLYAANPDVSDEVKGKFAALMDEHPLLKDEYERLGEPTAQAPDAPSAPTEPTTPTAADPGPPADQPAPTTVADEGGSGGLIAAGVAGLLATGVAVFIVARRKPARAVRRGPPDRLILDPDQPE